MFGLATPLSKVLGGPAPLTCCPFTFFGIGGSVTVSMRDFFQINSVGEGIPLSGAFLFSAVLDDGGGSSSSESSVKSITSVWDCDLPTDATDDGVADGGTITDEPLPKDGESSFFT